MFDRHGHLADQGGNCGHMRVLLDSEIMRLTDLDTFQARGHQRAHRPHKTVALTAQASR